MSLLFKQKNKVVGKTITVVERNGVTKSTETPIEFDGNVQPMTSRDISTMTEGRISTGMVRLYSERKLTVSTEGEASPSKGDQIQYKGFWYECTYEIDWNSDVSLFKSLNHYAYGAELRGRV